ncbi:hypothetical protein HVTV-2_gp45 [Haloarcula virus HVTV-2]|uniref:Uncharacterized protein n=1 Tax=Haloarcula vallismortis tailed virus 1 TaxID=1262528 RepID=L7TKA7_9CAUD|nr:hypothetical protein HVTV1_45 [Haloarcula vallismortis tailed virus 1]AGC34415.1 hypothetical protein HVTV1_45 [Haloarcula vallismortis tailed virus 1]UBF22852.1 hypothetical protein HVTV-2_gp45 [Haloarcula virus HVTV-2]
MTDDEIPSYRIPWEVAAATVFGIMAILLLVRWWR